MTNHDKFTQEAGFEIAGQPYKQPKNDLTLDLNQEHPDFSSFKDNYHRCRVFSIGGSTVEGHPEFLKRHVYESEKQYEIRLWLSKYRNHARPVINVFHSAIWDTPPDRSNVDSVLQSYFDNVDRQDTAADEFFSDVSRKAATAGVVFVLVDHTELPNENTPRTKKEADSGNLRPFFRIIDAEQLIDWGVEKDKVSGAEELSYVVIKEDVELSSIPFRGRKIQTQYTLWTKDKWEIWTQDENKAKMISSGDHKCGTVPIVPCFFEKRTEMTGYSVVHDIVGLCERIYRNSSCLDKSLYDTAFPLQLFLGFTPEQINNFHRSSSTGLIGETDSDSKYIEPGGRSFEELRNAIQSDENIIKELALRVLRPDSKAAESVESKRLDRKQLNSKLSEFASNIENCEIKCWQIFASWLGINNAQVKIEYVKNFDDDAITVEIISLFRDLADMQYIPSDDVVDLLIKSGMLPDDYDKEKAKEKIKDQNRIDSNYPINK